MPPRPTFTTVLLVRHGVTASTGIILPGRAPGLHLSERGVAQAYVQQEIEGRVVKFYGVSGGEYFTALADGDELPDAVHRAIAIAASTAASAIGLEAWGGDAVVSENGAFRIIDFNDWPSFSRVRGQAARAIARRATWLLQRARLSASRAGLP